MKKSVRVTITGAAGQIGYQLAFRIASGQMLGADQAVTLQLLEIPPAMPALDGVVMELHDCAFDTLDGVVATDDANVAFKDADFALLVGARPRGPGMERKDLLEANAQIFSVQGQAINEHASRDIRVLVVGNPANTNALITSSNAPDIDPANITAMTRLDHNRAIAQLAQKTGTHVSSVRRMTIWGNHSATQYPDLNHATVKGKPAMDQLDKDWVRNTFIPRVQKRGAEVIEARGMSSAASAAYAGLAHLRDWVNGSESGNWLSMAVPSDGSYDVPEGLIYSFPVTLKAGEWKIVQNLDIDAFSREKMKATQKELEEEREAVKDLI